MEWRRGRMKRVKNQRQSRTRWMPLKGHPVGEGGECVPERSTPRDSHNPPTIHLAADLSRHPIFLELAGAQKETEKDSRKTKYSGCRRMACFSTLELPNTKCRVDAPGVLAERTTVSKTTDSRLHHSIYLVYEPYSKSNNH